jgi:pimeloyl-ACP methyl ester carboxylesterase
MAVFLFPGLGADQRLFEYQTRALSEVVVPKWLEPLEGESLGAYAKRWAESLEFGPEDCLGGMSFGGQVALELARHLKPKCVFLIASHRRASEMSSLFKLQSRILKGLPDRVVRSTLLSIAIPKLQSDENLQPEVIELLRGMTEDMDMDFFRWSVSAAANWDYEFKAHDFSMPIYQIRGEGDNVIPNPKPGESEVVKGAKHLINYTHPEEVNQWILTKLRQLSLGSQASIM